MDEAIASPDIVRTRISQAPEYETITLGTYKIKNFPTRTALATALLTGCRAKELVSQVPKCEYREGLNYGVKGTSLEIEEYEGEEFLILNVIVLKKHLMTASNRTVAIPRKIEYEPLAKIIEDKFIQVGDSPVFPFTRQTLSLAAKQVFNGLKYYIHPYLRFEQKGKMAFEVQGHPRDMAIHSLRHVREEELEDFYHLEDRQIQAYFKWSNRFMGISEVMGRYRARRDWRMYAEKLLKRRILLEI
jgi:hypothetical protein